MSDMQRYSVLSSVYQTVSGIVSNIPFGSNLLQSDTNWAGANQRSFSIVKFSHNYGAPRELFARPAAGQLMIGRPGIARFPAQIRNITLPRFQCARISL